ncbi:MAG: polysaccharide transporter, family [Rhodospirillales bacterium]|nr:polysaccharide transporter, family [Rhodospirillales bacterium]
MDSRRPQRKAALGVLLLSGSNIFRLTVQFLLFPILARLLSPGDYGLIALAMPVVLLALTLGEGGMGPALVRSSDPRGEVEVTMFWTALATGTACAAVLMLASSLIADLLSHAKVAPVLMWLAPVLVFSAVSSVPSVRIQKSGATWIFAVGDVTSTIAGAAAALYGALTGWGVWSLVAQQLVVWTVKVAVLIGFAGLRVRGRPGDQAFRYLMRHGMPVVGANLLTLFSNSIDAILIGRLLGVQQLGFYALAYQIVRIPETVLNGPVLVSFLPAVVRLGEDRAAVAKLFLDSLRMMLSVSAPLMLGVALTADLSVPLLLGPRWHGTVPLLMVLAPPAIGQTLGWLSRALLLGRGRSGLQLGLALLNAILTVAGVLIGGQFGIFGIAAGVGFAVVVASFAYLIAALRETQLSIGALGAALGPTLSAATIMACGVEGLRLILPAEMSPFTSIGLAAAVGILLYGGAMQILAPETLVAAIAPFWRRVRHGVESSVA